MLPDKSIASLVKYYYSWKKTRYRTSVMDRQARKLQAGVVEEAARVVDENANAGQNKEGDDVDTRKVRVKLDRVVIKPNATNMKVFS